MKFTIIFLVGLTFSTGFGVAKADDAKPYMFASWLSEKENKRNAEKFSTLGTVVEIDMGEINPGDADYYALRYFADAAKRYSQATRFVAHWHYTFTDDQGFSRWVYDRNQQAVFYQSSTDGKTGWNGFCVTEPVGVTKYMVEKAAQKGATIYDLSNFGAINRRQYFKGRWIIILKSDPRVLAKRRAYTNQMIEPQSTATQ